MLELILNVFSTIITPTMYILAPMALCGLGFAIRGFEIARREVEYYAGLAARINVISKDYLNSSVKLSVENSALSTDNIELRSDNRRLQEENKELTLINNRLNKQGNFVARINRELQMKNTFLNEKHQLLEQKHQSLEQRCQFLEQSSDALLDQAVNGNPGLVNQVLSLERENEELQQNYQNLEHDHLSLINALYGGPSVTTPEGLIVIGTPAEETP